MHALQRTLTGPIMRVPQGGLRRSCGCINKDQRESTKLLHDKIRRLERQANKNTQELMDPADLIAGATALALLIELAGARSRGVVGNPVTETAAIFCWRVRHPRHTLRSGADCAELASFGDLIRTHRAAAA